MDLDPRTPVLGTQRLAGLEAGLARELLGQAVDSGVRWLDLADVYGPRDGDAERLVVGFDVGFITKGGLTRPGGRWVPNGKAGALTAAAERSRDRLGVDRLDLYLLHAPDPRVALRTTCRALSKLVDRGIAARVGLCNVTVGQLRVALDHMPVAAVQVQLGPLEAANVRSGIAEVARAQGIVVMAHRPLGGAERVARLRRNPVLRAAAVELGATPEQVALAWLGDLGLVPVPGPSRLETIQASVGAMALELPTEVRSALDEAFEAGRQLRLPRASRAPSPADGDVVLIMGSPGAGKSSRVALLPEHERLNRDERGGRLQGLIGPLEERLGSGRRRVVLDNTYPDRSSRNRVIEAAWRHGVSVRVEWLTTSDDDCEVNVCMRILDALGRLPEPDEIDALGEQDPGIIPPRALLKYRRQFEVPTPDEGFERIDTVAFRRREGSGRHAGLLVDPKQLDDPRVAAHDGPVAVLGWVPGAGTSTVDELRARAPDGAFVAVCPHPAGPPTCWCRKPWPGLGVLAIRTLGLDRARSTVLVGSPADRTFARKLGMLTG